MTTPRRTFWLVTAARRWRRCSSTSRAVVARPPVRLRNEPVVPACAHDLAAPRQRHGAALSLSAALVVVARPRADLLAGGAAAGLGLPAVLHRTEFRILRARRRRLHRRRHDVGQIGRASCR